MSLMFPKGKKRKRIKRLPEEEAAFEQPRSSTLRNPKYIIAVRDFPCVLTGKTPSDPAHISWGSMRGTALKPADDRVLPLCHELHVRQHQVGEVTFWMWAFENYPAFREKCQRTHCLLPAADIGGEWGVMLSVVAYAKKQYQLYAKGKPSWL